MSGEHRLFMNGDTQNEIKTAIIERVLACLEGRASMRELFTLADRLSIDTNAKEDKNIMQALSQIKTLRQQVSKGVVSQSLIKDVLSTIVEKVTYKPQELQLS